MVERQCVDCGTLGRPKRLHPSSFRAEVSVWFVALTVGAAAGLVSVVATSGPAPEAPELQRMALSVVGEADAIPTATEPGESSSTGNVGLRFAVWGRDVLLDFLRVAWWVLPFPMLFSLWRQFAEREGCAHCGSRHLVAVDPHP